MAVYLFGDVVDGVKAKAGGGLHKGMRAHHHVHQASTCTISLCLRKDLGPMYPWKYTCLMQSMIACPAV